MISGLYTAGLGMMAQTKRMDVVSNNIANANTTGFKRDTVVTHSFTEELLKRLYDPAGVSISREAEVGDISRGLFVDTVHTDFTSGTLRSTGGALDLAVDGSGFFTVSVTDKNGDVSERYTRDGAFTLSENRTLMTKDGHKVLGENGELVLPDGIIVIGENGQVKVNGEVIDTLRIADFQNPQSLRKVGESLFAATDETQAVPFANSVSQGYLENSNINSVREMVELISIARSYETNQKVVQNMDNIMGKIASEIGRR